MTPWTAARQASLSITNSQSLPKAMCIELVMPSSHLILCHPLLLPSVFPNIRVFSNESVICIRWPKYWSFIDFFLKCIKTPKLHCFYNIQNRDTQKCVLETSIPMTYFHLKNQKQLRNLFFNLIYRILNLTQYFMTFSLYFGGKISA